MTKNNKPTHRADIVRNDTDEETFRASIVRFHTDQDGLQRREWVDIGEGWLREDGVSISVNLTAFPVDGSFIIRPNEPKPEPTA